MNNELESMRGKFWPGMATHPKEDDEPTFANPYVDAMIDAGLDVDDRMHPFKIEAGYKTFELRRDFTLRYAWAIPNEEAISTIVGLSPILEIGAGLGYWAHLIFNAGGDIVAYDKHAGQPNHYVDENAEPWSLVYEGDVRKAMAGGRRSRTLFLCWPPMDGMAAQALRLHRGEHVVYVGESQGGCTADDDFFSLLEARYEHQTTVSIPQWMGLHDYLEVWKRK